MFYRRITQSTWRRLFVTTTSLLALGAASCFIVARLRYYGAYMAYVGLTNIWDGLHCYEEANGRLPTATATNAKSGERCSWRVEVYQSKVHGDCLPKREANGSGTLSNSGYDRCKAWNAPDNLWWQDRGAWLFGYTRAERNPPGQSVGKAGIYATYYKAVTGPGTAFDAGTPPSLKDLPKGLILVVRVERSDTHWMEPGDLSIEQLAPNEETRRLLLGKDGYVVLFADGEGWVLSGKTPISDLCKFFTIEGARKFDREKLLGPYRILPR